MVSSPGACVAALLRDLLETLFREVAIDGKSAGNLPPSHDFEARAVHEAQPPSGCFQEILHRGSVALGVYPFDVEKRHEDFLDRSYRLHAQTALYEGEQLNKYVVR